MRQEYFISACLCSCFSNPLRLEIIDCLREGEKNVGELVKCTGLPQPRISQQLSLMKKSGILFSQRRGKKVYYKIADKRIIKAFDLLNEVIECKIDREKEFIKKR